MPAPLIIDGDPTDLGDGKSLSLSDDVDIFRKGNVYLITGQSGDSVRAEVHATWINVSVGLGRSPVKVRGLIANANGNINQIETRDGTVLTNPFSFADVYHPLPIAGASQRTSRFYPFAGTGTLNAAFLKGHFMRTISIRRCTSVRERSAWQRA